MTRKRKRLMLPLLATFLAASLFAWGCNVAVGRAADGRVFSEAAVIPATRVAVVLGTAPLFNGATNPYFEGRMTAAAELYKARRVKRLLVSGTNDRTDYNEPDAMKAALIERGVPAQAIVEDFAGLRTLDTVVRTKEIFGLNECIFVTDDFHMARTLWLAEENGLKATGFTTRSLPVSVSPTTHLREIAARVLVVLDVKLFHRNPRFLGRREIV